MFRASRFGDYDARRAPIHPRRAEHTRAAMEQLVTLLVLQDVAGVEALLAEDVRALSDGGGEYHAARVPLHGRTKVAKFFVGVVRMRPEGGAALRTVNGLPALLAHFPSPGPGQAPRVLLALDTDDDGRVRAIYAVLASDKLRALPWP